MFDIITIGSATMDVFVESEDANIVSVSSKDKISEFMSYRYGSKIEIDGFSTNVGGGGINTAVNFSKLGFETSAIVKVGEDWFAKAILKTFEDKNIDMQNIIQDKKSSTGFSIILVSFEGDRTVLAHRGANAEIKFSELNLDMIKQAKLLYIAPLNGASGKVLEPLAKFAEENGVMTCFNAGTTSIKRGFEYVKKIIETAEVVVMNKEEASMCTKIEVRPDTKDVKYSSEKIHPDVVEMLKKLKVNERQIIVITDGKNGAYAYNGKNIYLCPIFPGKVVSSLGAGDAFASTFCAALAESKLDIGRALMMASVNSGGVVSEFSATDGLLTFDEIKQRLADNPDYKFEVI